MNRILFLVASLVASLAVLTTAQASDVFVTKEDDQYKIVLNDDGLPRLRISPTYRRMLDGKDEVTTTKPDPHEAAESGRMPADEDKVTMTKPAPHDAAESGRMPAGED